MTTVAYYRKFSDMVNAMDHYGGSVRAHSFLITENIELQTGHVYDPTGSYDVTLMENARKSSSDDYLACLFLTNACQHCYGKIVTTLHYQYVLVLRKYPSTLDDAYSLIDDIKPLKSFAPAKFSASFAQVPKEPVTGAVPTLNQAGTSLVQNSTTSNKIPDRKLLSCRGCQEPGAHLENCKKTKCIAKWKGGRNTGRIKHTPHHQ